MESGSGSESHHLHPFIEVLPAAVVLTDDRGCVLSVNAKAREVLGDVGDRSWSELAHRFRLRDGSPLTPDDDPVLAALSGETGGIATELIVQHESGSDRRVHVSALLAPMGELSVGLIVVDDVDSMQESPARLAAVLAELENQNAQFQAILRGSSQAIALFDGLDLRVHWANAEFKRMIGLPEEAPVRRRRLQELLPDAETSGMARAFRSVASDGQPLVTEEDEWRGECGTEYWRWSLTPVRRADGIAHDLVMIANEVTYQVQERLTAETRLHQLEAVLAQMTDGVAIVDQNRLITLNDAARRILRLGDEFPARFPMRDLLEYAHFELPDGSPAGPLHSPFLRVLRGERVSGEEVRLVDNEGQARLLSMSARPVDCGHSGDSPIVVVNMHDITARKVLEQRMAQEAELDRALGRISTAVGATLDSSDILRRTCREACEALGGCGAFVVSRMPTGWIVREASGECAPLLGKEWGDQQAEAITLAADARMPIFVEDARTEARLGVVPPEGHVGAIVAVPLMVRGEVSSVLGVEYSEAPRRFTKAEEDFVDKLAQCVSLSLENARLYQVEHRIAEALQESLLALPEQIDGLDFAYLYRSAKETARVGGDFYDVFEIDDDVVAFLIGDVSGKGLEAAATTSLIKSTLKAHAYEGDSPATTLQKANSIMLRTSPPESFSTVFFGLLRRSTGELAYCGAGHPPALLVNHGHVRTLETRCPVLGALSSAWFSDSNTIMLPGDKLLLYTDGITEARRGNELYGEQRLLDFLEAQAALPLWDIPQALLSEVTLFAEGRLHDDIALLAISPQLAADERAQAG